MAAMLTECIRTTMESGRGPWDMRRGTCAKSIAAMGRSYGGGRGKAGLGRRAAELHGARTGGRRPLNWAHAYA